MKWKCKRCNQEVDMEKFNCGCTISPSPWYPVKEIKENVVIAFIKKYIR